MLEILDGILKNLYRVVRRSQEVVVAPGAEQPPSALAAQGRLLATGVIVVDGKTVRPRPTTAYRAAAGLLLEEVLIRRRVDTELVTEPAEVLRDRGARPAAGAGAVLQPHEALAAGTPPPALRPLADRDPLQADVLGDEGEATLRGGRLHDGRLLRQPALLAELLALRRLQLAAVVLADPGDQRLHSGPNCASICRPMCWV